MRKRIARRVRKNIMCLGTITEEKTYSRDDDGTKLPKKERGYSVHAIVNGYKIYSIDHSMYEALQGCYYCAKWFASEKSFVPVGEQE